MVSAATSTPRSAHGMSRLSPGLKPVHFHECVASRVIDVVVFPSVGELVQDRERIARAEVDPQSRAVAVELPSESVAACVVLVNMDLEIRQCEPCDSECCVGVCDLFVRPLVRSVNNMRWVAASENGSSTVPMGGVTVASKTLAADTMGMTAFMPRSCAAQLGGSRQQSCPNFHTFM